MRRRPLLKTLGAVGSGLGVGATTATLASTPAAASASGALIDDFDGGNLNDYTIDRDASGASIVSEQTYSGSNALKLHGTGTELLSFNGLANYPERGDSFSVYVYATNNAQDINITYGGQDKSNRYVARVEFDDDNIRFFRYENNSLYSLAKELTDSGIGMNEWYEVRIDWSSNSQHTMGVYTTDGTLLKEISVTESTWSEGGFGYDGYLYDGGTVYFDHASLTGASADFANALQIDDFEDGDISEYSIDRDASGVSVVSAPTFSGSNALAISGTNSELLSTDGLANYPTQGDTFSTFVRATGGAAAINITYGAQDKSNRYVAKLSFANDSILLFRYEDDTLYNLSSNYNAPPLNEDTWYEVAVAWGRGGEHVLAVYDTAGNTVDTITATDSTWSSGGFGYDAYLSSSGGTAYFDSALVTKTGSLGGFQTSNDGWAVSANTTLSRVDEGQQPAAITEGTHALKMEVNDGPEPVLQNEERGRNADLSNYPYLLADMLPEYIDNSDTPVTFRFRYHHGESNNIEESPEFTIDQQRGGVIGWDMSELSEAKLASPERLEIVWYPDDHPPGSGFEHSGRVFVDNIRLSNNQNEVTHAMSVRNDNNLERAHGIRVNETIQSQSNASQKGTYEYADGTEISYEAERIGSEYIEERYGGNTLQWKVGSQ